MNPLTSRFYLVPLLAAAGPLVSSAALIVTEGFDYTLGSTLTSVDGNGADANGGSGFSGAWDTARVDTVVAGFTDTRSASPGGGSGNAILVSHNATGRVWDGSSYGTEGSTIWFSVLMSTSGSGFNGAFISRMMLFSSGPNMASGNGFGFELTTAGNLVARLAGSNSATVATYTQDVSNFVLGRFVNSASGNDSLELWINPTEQELLAYSSSGLLADLGAADSSVLTATANVTFAANSGIYLRAGNSATSNWTADELRIGTAFLDVAAIPEPSAAAALAGLAGLGLALTRRRRR
jgi:hypothetical protein